MTVNWLSAAIEGVVEGVTEFIPVSSTGHLLLTEHLLQARFSDVFTIVIQAGAVLAVLPLFRPRLAQFAGWRREPAAAVYLLKIALAFAITGVGGLLLEHHGYALPESPLPVALALLLGGAAFLLAEARVARRPTRGEVTWTMAAAVGAAQLVAALFPGTSRSGATIVALLLLNLSRPAATEFSFLVGIPTMLAAGAVSIYAALARGAPHEPWGLIALGTAVSAGVSFGVVRWLLGFVRSHTFRGFAWYRIAVGSLLLALAAGGCL